MITTDIWCSSIQRQDRKDFGQQQSEGVKFEKFVDKLYQAGVFDLKIIESIDYDHGFVTSEDHGQDTEDTLSLE